MAVESTSGRPVRHADTIIVQTTPGVRSSDLGIAAKPLSPDSEGFLPPSFEIFTQMSPLERNFILAGLDLSAVFAPKREELGSGFLVDGTPVEDAYRSLKEAFRTFAGIIIRKNNLNGELRRRGLDNLADNLMYMVKGVPREDIGLGISELKRRLALQGKDK